MAKKPRNVGHKIIFHALVAGHNRGQGSSREHAALTSQYLGLWLALTKGFVRLHWQNLINAAVLPLTFENEADYDQLEQGDVLLRLIRLNPSQSVTATLCGDWTTWPNIGKNGALRAGLVYLAP